MQAGLLLFAHGARDARWAEPFEAICAQVRERSEIPVELAYLELMTPSLIDAVARLKARGCTAMTVVPLFLGQGGHLRRDLPALIEVVRKEHPELSITVSTAAGEAPDVLEAMVRYCLAQAPKTGA